MLLAAAITSCAGPKTGVSAETPVAHTDLLGQWYLENIVFNDSDYVRPADEVPGIRQYITFEDSSFYVQTNCNIFTGPYTTSGDSISFSDWATTEMACDNMATEDALRRILPLLSTIEVESDTIVRINGHEGAGYMILRRATEKK